MVLGNSEPRTLMVNRGWSPDVSNVSRVPTPRRGMTGRVPSPFPQTQLPALSVLYRGRPVGSSGSDSGNSNRYEYNSSSAGRRDAFETRHEDKRTLWCQKCHLILDELKDEANRLMHHLRVQASRNLIPVGETLLIKRLHEKLNTRVLFGGGESCQLVQGCCRDCHTHLAQLKHVAVTMVQNSSFDQRPKMSRAAVPPSRLGTPTPNSRPPTSVVRPMAAQPLIPRTPEVSSSSRGQIGVKRATHHHVHHHLHQHHHQPGLSKIPTPVVTSSPYSELIAPPRKQIVRESDLHQVQGRRVSSPGPVGMCPGSLTSMIFKRGGNSRSIMTSRQSKTAASPANATLTGASPTSQQSTSCGAVPAPVAQQAQQYLEQNIQAWMQPKPHHSRVLTSSLTSMVSPRGTQYDERTSVNGLSPSSSTGSSTGANQEKLRSSSAQLPGGYNSTNPRFYSSNLSLASPGQAGSGNTVSNGASVIPAVGVTSMSSIIPGLPTSTSFPHSLSFSGYSQASALQGTSFSSPCASSNYVVTQQPSAAASFFARAAQRLNLSSKKRRRHHSGSEPEALPFRTNFSEIVKNSPPPAPPALLRGSGRIKDATGLGKVKVMLRICHGRSDGEDSSADQSTSSSFLNVDQRKKQLSVFDPSACGLSTPADRRAGVSAPKMFAFDAIFSQDDTQTEVCSSSLTDVIQAVVNGNDGCLFVYGHSKLGKTYTMSGGWSSTQELGVIPCSLCWLFRLINEQKQRTGARFSVRVSAVEITGKNENLRDLLSDIASGTEGSGPSPAIYLRDDPIFGTRLMNHSELRAPTAEKAAFLLDAALAARSVAETDEDSRNSHFLFTLHVYQYRVEKGGKGGVAGGRSRLHLFDLGSCEKQAKPREGGVGGQCLTLSALGNVILALFNGQKHVPCKDSKVTQIMREALGSLTCRAAMIAHVSSHPNHYAESLSTIQLASRVHRMRRKKLKYMGVGTTDTVDDKLCRPFVRSHAVSDDGVKSGSSDPDYTSSSEQSCDTVIYVGAAGLPLPERDLTDNEGPPPLVPPTSQARNVASQISSGLASGKGAKTTNVINNNHTPSSADQVPTKNSSSAITEENETNGSSSNATAAPKSASAKHNAPRTLNRSQLVTNEIAHQKSSSTTTAGGQTANSTATTPRKSGGPKRTQNAAKSGNAPGGQANPNPKPNSTTKDGTSAPPTKDPKVQSDELWIDGPRFCKPRFDSRTLHQLQKEQWVDGPAVNYGYMDDHKQDMILKWVEEHSKHAQSKQERSKEVWIDFPRGPVAGPGSGGMLVEGQTTDYHRRPSFASHGDRSHRTSSSLRRAKEEAKRKAAVVSASQHHSAKEDAAGTAKLTTAVLDGDRLVDSDDNNDSASTSADIDDGDNELGNMTNDLDDEEIKDDEFQGTLEELEETLSKTRQVILEYGESDEESGDEPPETIEVMDPEEPVQMTDSCLQVNEEDIMAACWMLDDASENPLPEVDQESLEGSDEHPLRILSREGLNLASSFTDSRSVSVDLETMSVPDDTPRSWRDYVRGPKLRDPASFAAAIRLTDPDETSSVHSSFRSDLFSQKLERIARLREISLAAAEGTKFSDRASDDISFSKTNSTPKLNSGLPSRTARLTMSDMLFGSRDSSLDDMVEDVTSIHSEPAELDFDRCDYKFNIKPMNGLKLEAFYNKLYNTTSFLEQALQAKSPSTSLLSSASRIPSAKRQVAVAPSPSCYAVPKLESAAHQRSSAPLTAPNHLPTDKIKAVGSCRNLSGNVSDTGGELSEGVGGGGAGSKRNSLDERKRRSYITSLRHPDGASNPHLNKHPSITQISPPTPQQITPRMSHSPSTKSRQRSPGSGACVTDTEEKPITIGAPELASALTYQLEYGTPFQYDKQTVPILTPGQSPTAKMSRLSRLLGRSGSGATINSEKTSKSGSSSKQHKSPKSSPKMSCRSTPNASPSRQQQVVGTPYGARSPAWIPTRSSPTSSSTGAPTMCCNSMKAIGGRSSKNKQSTVPSNGQSKHSPKIDKQQRKAAQAAAQLNSGCGQNGNCCSGTNGDTKEHKKAQKSKILARSSSSPVTSCDEKENVGEEAESEEQTAHAKTPLMTGDPSVRKRSGTVASSSSGLPSPYSLITKARLTRHSSSGHGSDSSVNSGDLRDGKEPLMKGTKGQQCSGTSSGYESILRDSEGTPLSSSSQESECDDLTAEGRGRKGKRKKSQGGSTKRSRSAPARVPNGNGQQRSPGASGNGASSAFLEQPRATGNGRSARHHHHIQQHWGNGRLRTSEDDVCCTGLLCCRLLDFY